MLVRQREISLQNIGHPGDETVLEYKIQLTRPYLDGVEPSAVGLRRLAVLVEPLNDAYLPVLATDPASHLL